MIIALKDVSKSYGDIRALEGVTMEVREGEMLGLVGPNGSGKSTMLKVMLGIIRPTSGGVFIKGEDVSGKDWKEFKRSIGYMPERVSFYDNLTGKETLKLIARLKGGSLEAMSDVIGRLLSDDVLKRRVGDYSKGMRQRLNLAQALINDPDILVLDEPTSGLDPVGTREFYEILGEVGKRKSKLTVVLSSHILAEIEDKTDRIAIIKNGSLKAIGRLEELYRGLRLPLRITITVKRKDEVLEEILRREGAEDLGYKNGYLLASVPGESKMNILSAIMKEKERFVDVDVREPNLEEVFFGVH